MFGITSDQGSNLECAFKQMGSTPSHPIIKFNDREYIVYKDPPHLLKSARNFILNHNVALPGNSFQAPAHWQTLINFYEENQKNTIRLAHKITKKHLFDLKFQNKMKVKLVSQVLSNSCAAAIKFYSTINKFVL